MLLDALEKLHADLVEATAALGETAGEGDPGEKLGRGATDALVSSMMTMRWPRLKGVRETKPMPRWKDRGRTRGLGFWWIRWAGRRRKRGRGNSTRLAWRRLAAAQESLRRSSCSRMAEILEVSRIVAIICRCSEQIPMERCLNYISVDVGMDLFRFQIHSSGVENFHN